MKRFFILAMILGLSLALSATAMAYQTTHDPFKVGFEGTMLNHKAGVRIGNLDVRFTDEGLTHLNYRVTPLMGKVTLVDVLALAGDKVIYQRSKERKLDVDLHFFESKTKHWEETILMKAPVKEFNKETGKIQFVFLAAGKKYLVTWTMVDNEFKTNVVEDKPAAPAAPATPAAATDAK